MTIGLSGNELCGIIEAFGDLRSDEGDEFGRNRYIGPTKVYYYVTGGVLTSAVVWGTSDTGSISFFSCARAGMIPTLGLYRYISLWRSTAGFGAPYVAEFNNRAAVMVERDLSGHDFKNDEVIARHVAVTFDVISGTSKILGEDLSGADGGRLEEKAVDVEGAQMAAHQYWQLTDSRISKLMGIT